MRSNNKNLIITLGLAILVILLLSNNAGAVPSGKISVPEGESIIVTEDYSIRFGRLDIETGEGTIVLVKDGNDVEIKTFECCGIITFYLDQNDNRDDGYLSFNFDTWFRGTDTNVATIDEINFVLGNGIEASSTQNLLVGGGKIDSASGVNVIFEDNFDSYTTGSFPSSGGWDLQYNGIGTPYQIVDNSQSTSSPNSLKLEGQANWAATADYPLSTIADQVVYEGDIKDRL